MTVFLPNRRFWLIRIRATFLLTKIVYLNNEVSDLHCRSDAESALPTVLEQIDQLPHVGVRGRHRKVVSVVISVDFLRHTLLVINVAEALGFHHFLVALREPLGALRLFVVELLFEALGFRFECGRCARIRC